MKWWKWLMQMHNLEVSGLALYWEAVHILDQVFWSVCVIGNLTGLLKLQHCFSAHHTHVSNDAIRWHEVLKILTNLVTFVQQVAPTFLRNVHPFRKLWMDLSLFMDVVWCVLVIVSRKTICCIPWRNAQPHALILYGTFYEILILVNLYL